MTQKPITILVIEDEEDIREFLVTVFQQAGYTVIEASNGKAGMKAVRESAVDIVVTDIVMPDQEGMETIRAIRSANPGIKIIAISGAVNKELYLKVAGGLGADASLKKPFQSDAILKTVEQVTGGHEA